VKGEVDNVCDAFGGVGGVSTSTPCSEFQGITYSGSYKVGFSTHATFFLKLLQNQAQTTAF